MIEFILGIAVLVAIGWLLIGPIAFIVILVRQRDLQSQLRTLQRRIDSAEVMLRREAGPAQRSSAAQKPPAVPGPVPGAGAGDVAANVGDGRSASGQKPASPLTMADIVASASKAGAQAADEAAPSPAVEADDPAGLQAASQQNASDETDHDRAAAGVDAAQQLPFVQSDAGEAEAEAEATGDVEQAVDGSREAARDRLMARDATSLIAGDVEPQTEADSDAAAGERPMSFEEMLAGRWTAWVGAFALVLGAGFFFKYAIDQGWIGPTIRVAVGCLVGTALYIGGVFAVRKSYDWLSQGLVAASLGVIYFSLYAACRWFEYPVMPDQLAFAGMCVATAAAFFFAGVFNAQPTAVLALLGGLLTPIMLSKGGDSHWVYFGYLLMLDLGALGVATFRKWPHFNMLVYVTAVLMWLRWMAANWAPPLILDISILMSVFYVVFALLGVWHHLIQKTQAKAQDFGLIFAAPLSYFAGLLFVTWSSYPHWHGFIAVAMSMLYVVLTVAAVQREGLDRKIAFAFGGIATLFATVAIPLQFSGHWITIGWAVEALILFEMGVRFRDRWLSRAGLAVIGFVTLILGLYAMRTLVTPGEFTTFLTPAAAASKSLWLTTPVDPAVRWFDIFNARSFTFLAAVVAIGVMSWEALRRCRPGDDDDENIEAIGVTRMFGKFLRVFAAWLTLVMILVETFAMWARLEAGPAALLVLYAIQFAAFAVVLFQTGLRLNGGGLTRSGMAGVGLLQLTLTLLAIGTLVAPATFTTYFVSNYAAEVVSRFDVFNARLLAFAVGIVTMAGVARSMLRKCRTTDDDAQLQILGIAESAGRGLLGWSICMIYVMLAVETFSYWSRLDGSLPVLLTSLAIEGVVLGLIVQLAGVLTKQRWFEWLSAIGYALAVVLSVFNFGLVFLTWARFSERLAGSEDGLGVWGLLLLNPRGLGFVITIAGLIAAAVYSRLTRDDDEQRLDDLDQVCGLGAIVLGWLLVTSETYAWGVAHDWGTATSLGVTLAWTLYAVGMLLGGIFIRSGGLRIMSLALLGLTTAKVFLVDIWQLDTTIRTFAFMGLGASLMLVSWLYRRYRARIHEWIAAEKAASAEVS